MELIIVVVLVVHLIGSTIYIRSLLVNRRDQARLIRVMNREQLRMQTRIQTLERRISTERKRKNPSSKK